jgi:hypothetical protein
VRPDDTVEVQQDSGPLVSPLRANRNTPGDGPISEAAAVSAVTVTTGAAAAGVHSTTSSASAPASRASAAG